MSGTLPRSKDDPTPGGANRPVSPVRFVQLNTMLEGALEALFPAGVLTGGVVTATTGFSVSVGASAFLAEGVRYPASGLSSPQVYTAAEASTNVRLWGRIGRLPADQGDPAASDTWRLDLLHTFGAGYATAPSSALLSGESGASVWFALADWNTDGGGVSGPIDYGPAAKYLKLASPLWQGKTSIGAAEVAVIAADEQFVSAAPLTVTGVLYVKGILLFL